MTQTARSLEQSYKEILEAFLDRKNEIVLYEAEQFSKIALEHRLSPEELVSIHRTVLEEVFPSVSVKVLDSFDFLLEVMVGYGLAYREHQSLKDRQLEIESEIEVAAHMQHALLPRQIPKLRSLDIGVISVPARKMSGDYYNVILDDYGCLRFAIADIIGKGVPAALCMSMIKYGMDSMREERLRPADLLEGLNRVVEHNIADNMFVTMMYGSYDPITHQFSYSGAGHEPGFIYRANSNEFAELYVQGMALGLTRKAKYDEKHTSLDMGDFIVLLTDGVTECRVQDQFIERHDIIALLKKYKHLSAQKMVDRVYYDLLKRQAFVLKDDFTLMIIRRHV